MFKNVMKTMVKAVNSIRSQALDSRQFKELIAGLEEEYPDIPYRTGIRFLSQGKVCTRFFLDFEKQFEKDSLLKAALSLSSKMKIGSLI